MDWEDTPCLQTGVINIAKMSTLLGSGVQHTDRQEGKEGGEGKEEGTRKKKNEKTK